MTTTDDDHVDPRAVYRELVEALGSGMDVPTSRIEQVCADAGIDAAQFECDLSAAGRAAGEVRLQEIIDDAKAKAWSKGWEE